jgi:DUF2924 family protein
MSEMIDLAAELAELASLGRADLVQRWRTLYRAAPPACYTPDLLARGVAYRLQEQRLGALPSALRRELERDPLTPAKPRRSLKSGNRLVLRWRGRTYVVDVVGQSFQFDGTSYRSLSEIARKITGTRWSGPRFFGLVE